MTTSEYNICVDEHADGLYRFILKNMKDEEEARDIVQDAFEKTWRHVESIEGKKLAAHPGSEFSCRKKCALESA